jgi:hypothetical protein
MVNSILKKETIFAVPTIRINDAEFRLPYICLFGFCLAFRELPFFFLFWTVVGGKEYFFMYDRVYVL